MAQRRRACPVRHDGADHGNDNGPRHGSRASETRSAGAQLLRPAPARRAGAAPGQAGVPQRRPRARRRCWPTGRRSSGPSLAAVSAPRRLAAGTLTIACAGPVAMELQHYATELMDRINTHLGSPAVKALRFVQTALPAPPPAARAPADSRRGRARPPRPPSPACRTASCARRWPRWAARCWPPNCRAGNPRQPDPPGRRITTYRGHHASYTPNPTICCCHRNAPAGVSPRPPTNPQESRAQPRHADKAKITVDEWFSLTCTHCAAFATETFRRSRPS